MNKRNKAFTIDEVKDYVANNSGSLLLSEKYSNNQGKLLFLCFCGRKFETTFSSFKVQNKRTCDACGYETTRQKQVLLDEDVLNRIRELGLKVNIDKFLYKNAHSKLFLWCNICGKEYSSNWASLSQGLNKICRKCLYERQGSKRKMNFENIKLFLLENNLILLSEEKDYKNNKSKLKIRCSCNNVYFKDWVHLQQYDGITCSECSKTRESTLAKKVKEFCSSEFSSTILEYRIFKNPKTKRFLPYDVFISEYNLYIEIHGGQHYYETSFFGGKEELKNRKRLDKIKKKFAIQNGFFLELAVHKIKDLEHAKSLIHSKIKEIENG